MSLAGAPLSPERTAAALAGLDADRFRILVETHAALAGPDGKRDAGVLKLLVRRAPRGNGRPLVTHEQFRQPRKGESLAAFAAFKYRRAFLESCGAAGVPTVYDDVSPATIGGVDALFGAALAAIADEAEGCPCVAPTPANYVGPSSAMRPPQPAVAVATAVASVDAVAAAATGGDLDDCVAVDEFGNVFVDDGSDDGVRQRKRSRSR